MQSAISAINPVVFINTDSEFVKISPCKLSKQRHWNKYECIVILGVLHELKHRGIEAKDIGLLTPYLGQFHLLKKIAGQQKIDVFTIDKSQGIDKDCIIISWVKQRGGEERFIDMRRINVAFTRAKKKLIIIGSCKHLGDLEYMGKYIQLIRENGWVVDLGQFDQLKLRLKDIFHQVVTANSIS